MKKIAMIEQFAAQHMDGIPAHGYEHANRVRHWGLQIARGEGFAELALVEAAALLHDVGLAHVEDRHQHGEVAAEMTAAFLQEQNLFTKVEIEAIAYAIRYHNSLRRDTVLLTILCDADVLDLLGAVGVIRGCSSMHARPDYDPTNVKGETWGFGARDFDRFFAAGKPIGRTIVDHLNFQRSCAENLQTPTACRLARPLTAYLEAFVLQLEAEIENGRQAVATRVDASG